MDALTVNARHRLSDFDLEVALEVAPGQTVALVGPSGAGKTTVLRIVAGLLAPDEGRVALGARVLLDTACGVNLPPEARGVGMVFQDYALFPHMTVRANIEFAGREGTSVLMERFALEALADRWPSSLSGGERQRVALARALAARPRVLLLDEPLSALDADTRERMRGQLLQLLQYVEVPTVVVSHDAADVEALADSVISLEAGRIVPAGVGSPQ